jgi:hypothetical protein
MYTHPEITRTAAAQRITEWHARADADRRARRARQSRKPGRIRRNYRRWPFRQAVTTIAR